MDDLRLSIEDVADILVSQSTILKCSLEEAWNTYMHPITTESFSYTEVIEYIKENVQVIKCETL